MTRPLTTEQAIVRELRRRILCGELATGGQVLQDAIAEEFRVSRAPVRDALRVLEGEELIFSEPHRGYRVTVLDWSDLIEINAIREILEEEALRVAFPAIDEAVIEEMAELEGLMSDQESAGDMPAWVETHRRFHFRLFDAGGGAAYLSKTLAQLWNSADVYRSRYVRTTVGRESAAAQHSALLGAARMRNLGDLLSIMSAHRRSTMENLRAEIEGDDRE